MEVSVSDSKITHAIVSSHEAMSMGITDNAEFYHLLSSTLYSNEKLAAVREILCNGWDAHIDASISTPLKITLNSNQISFRDFGKGIPPDQIQQIYGVYGNSTKKLDGNKTGGFGLGSKAPFAYTDHFTVKNIINDRMYIYKVTKSNMETDGKPAIILLVDIPTSEPTGLEVSFDIQNNDQHTFFRMCKHVNYYGGFPITINGTLFDGIDYSKAKHGFVIEHSPNKELLGGSTNVYIKYGSVVYPVPEQFEKLFDAKHSRYRNILTTDTAAHAFIFLAPANSITVTPSRESLNISARTEKTLKDIAKNFTEYCKKILSKNVDLYGQYCGIVNSQINTKYSHSYGAYLSYLLFAGKIPIKKNEFSIRQAVKAANKLSGEFSYARLIRRAAKFGITTFSSKRFCFMDRSSVKDAETWINAESLKKLNYLKGHREITISLYTSQIEGYGNYYAKGTYYHMGIKEAANLDRYVALFVSFGFKVKSLVSQQMVQRNSQLQDAKKRKSDASRYSSQKTPFRKAINIQEFFKEVDSGVPFGRVLYKKSTFVDLVDSADLYVSIGTLSKHLHILPAYRELAKKKSIGVYTNDASGTNVKNLGAKLTREFVREELDSIFPNPMIHVMYQFFLLDTEQDMHMQMIRDTPELLNKILPEYDNYKAALVMLHGLTYHSRYDKRIVPFYNWFDSIEETRFLRISEISSSASPLANTFKEMFISALLKALPSLMKEINK